jgi:hypothetical protein
MRNGNPHEQKFNTLWVDRGRRASGLRLPGLPGRRQRERGEANEALII